MTISYCGGFHKSSLDHFKFNCSVGFAFGAAMGRTNQAKKDGKEDEAMEEAKGHNQQENLEESREQVIVREGKEHRGQHRAQAPV